jgi:hypothetical protein
MLQDWKAAVCVCNVMLWFVRKVCVQAMHHWGIICSGCQQQAAQVRVELWMLYAMSNNRGVHTLPVSTETRVGRGVIQDPFVWSAVVGGWSWQQTGKEASGCCSPSYCHVSTVCHVAADLRKGMLCPAACVTGMANTRSHWV